MLKNPHSYTAYALILASYCTASLAQQAIDITGTVLSSRNSDCATFIGHYKSDVFDHVNKQQAEGQIHIDADHGQCTFTINQIPNHDFGQNVKWPHKPAPNDSTITIPRKPEFTDQITTLGLSPGAVLLNGVKWEPNPAACFGEGGDSPGNERIGCGPRFKGHPWRYNVGASENNFRFDDYHAHVQKGGLYHYHATPRVLYSKGPQLMTDADCEALGESPVIGFALDGFPLFGPCIKDDSGVVRLVKSSYVLKTGERAAIEGYTTPYITGVVISAEYNGQFVGDYEYIAASGDLDECNGATNNGQYGYYTTNEYPYAMRCLRGTTLVPIR